MKPPSARDWQNPIEYDKARLTIERQKSDVRNKWMFVTSMCILGFSAIIITEYGLGATWNRDERSLESILKQGGTTFHLVHKEESNVGGRWRRAVSSGVIKNEEGQGTANGDGESGSGDGSAGSGDENGSGGSTGSGDEGSDSTTAESTTASMSGASGDGTTAAEFSGFGPTATVITGTATDAGGGQDATTKSMFDGSGDETTGSGEAATTKSMFAGSGDETTMPEFSGFGPTTSLTTVPDETTRAVKPTTQKPDPVVIQTTGSGQTTAFVIGASTTPLITESTTPVVAADAGPEIWVYIVIGVGAFILGVVLVLIFQALAKALRKKSVVTPLVSPTPSQPHLRDDGKPPELSWLMTREDMVLRAMALGNIGVLEFAIAEARTTGMVHDNPQLMKESEARLNQWKRTKTQLEGAYKARDVVMMEEFMRRFDDLQMKDESGIYQKCVDLQWDRTQSKLNMKSAAEARDEDALIASIARFESLKFPEADVAADADYQHATQVLEEIRQEKLLKGQTHDEIRNLLRGAVVAMNAALIAKAISTFIKAEVPDEYDDIAKAKKALEEIEMDRKNNLELSLKKMEEASFARDQEALKQSIDDCRKYGASEEDLRAPEKLLRVVEKEDKLLAEIRELVDTEDMGKLSSAIVMFRSPAYEMVDKTGDVAKAEEALNRLQENERMRKTKTDVMWRLQNAIAVGDVMAMDGMIKALQTLGAAGEEIDEPFLIRALGELEACRGQVDYRKKMEAIKSAIPRTVAVGNIPQLEDLVDQMSLLAEDEKYTMTADDSRVLDSSRATLNNLKNKKAIVDEIATVKPNLTIPYIPQNLETIKESISRMSEAKKDASEFDDVFTEEDENLLQEAKYNSEVLEDKIEAMTNARERLDKAVDAREYPELKRAIRHAIQAPFIQKQELIEPRKLAIFLDPKARRMAVKTGMRARDIRKLEVALQDFKDARVEDENLLLKGERTLDKLHKREKRRKRQEKRKEKEDAKRTADILRLTSILQSAIDSRDTEHLQLALEEFEESGYDEDDVPLATKAEELYDNLKIQDLRDKLVDSIKRRDLSGLEDAIDEADYGGYVMDVKEEYDVAKDLLYHLRELKRLREAIAEMNRSLISEIHKYPTPPAPVHQVMTAAFILLGESQSKMKNWQEVQALLGKLGQNAVTRRVRICAPGDISASAVKKAEQHIKNLKLEEVAEISKGAATFYAWTTCMIKERAQVSSDNALAELPIPDIGIPDERAASRRDYSWVEKNA